MLPGRILSIMNYSYLYQYNISSLKFVKIVHETIGKYLPFEYSGEGGDDKFIECVEFEIGDLSNDDRNR